MKFEQLNLIEPLLRAVQAEGYDEPTPIQQQGIPHVLAGKDLIGCAQTGTGKTAAFALPILQRIDEQRRAAMPYAPRALVLAPTRELAAQIGQSFSAYGRFIKFRQAIVYGGISQVPQVRALSRGAHVVVATPGRLLDLMDQDYVRLDKLEVFVLDEADRMFDMGFLPALRRIVACLPKQRQSLFFSATMPDEIAGLADKLLRDPVRVEVVPQSTTAERIDQQVLLVTAGAKATVLAKVLEQHAPERALVFTRTKRNADRVAMQLVKQGYRAAAIHGNKSQNQRTRTMDDFRRGTLHILVATDLAARGIDVDGISHVINYDLPDEPASYVHRIGRTARAGATGVAISFCELSQRGLLRSIERMTNQTLPVDPAFAGPGYVERSVSFHAAEHAGGARSPNHRRASKPRKAATSSTSSRSANGSSSRSTARKPAERRGKYRRAL